MPHPVLTNGGTSAEWALENPILPANTTGTETDTSRTKIGNGSSYWNSLKYTDEPSGPDILALAVSNAINESDKDVNIGVDSSHNWGEQTAAQAGRGLSYFPDIKNTAYSDGVEFIRQASVGLAILELFTPIYSSDTIWASWTTTGTTKTVTNGIVKGTTTAGSLLQLAILISGNSKRVKARIRVTAGTLSNYKIGIYNGLSTVYIPLTFVALNEWLEIDADVPSSLQFHTQFLVQKSTGVSAGDAFEIEYFKVGDIFDSASMLTYDAVIAANNLVRTVEIYVHPTAGYGDYQTIALAMVGITDETAFKQYRLKVAAGTYTDKLTMRNYIHIEGINKELCIIAFANPASASDANITAFSAIDYNAKANLSNFTITGKNCRYAIHPDSGATASYFYESLVKNCYIEHLGNQEVVDYRVDNSLPAGSVWSSQNAVGSGTSWGQKFTYEDCEMVSPAKAFSVHNNTNVNRLPSFVYLRRCRFSLSKEVNADVTGGASAIGIYSIGAQTRDKIYLEDCEIDGKIYYSESGWVSGTPATRAEWDVQIVNSTPVLFDNGLTTIASDKYYRPTVLDKQVELWNNTGATILRGMALAYDTATTNCRAMVTGDTADKFIGIAKADFATATRGVVMLPGQLEADWFIYGDGVVTAAFGTSYGISTTVPGAFKIGETPEIARGIGANVLSY